MQTNLLIEKILRVEEIASASKFRRMLMNPFKYFYAVLYRELIYKKNKREKQVITKTFFDTKMHLLLPSGTDIYLTGGKSHDSEIRLAKFLIKNLQLGDTFVDVGAHFGYFTLLGSKLVGDSGKVYSFEASPSSFKILNINSSQFNNTNTQNLAVSDEKAELTFYEFPNLYSEYNTLDINQFKNEDWFLDYKPKEVKIKSIVLDDFLQTNQLNPKVVKIDVEGAEYKVIKGLEKSFKNSSPMIILEYLSVERGNEQHIKAEKLLAFSGYQPYIIKKEGEIIKTSSISNYLKESKLESDNIVFIKS